MWACMKGKVDTVKLLLNDDRIDCEAKDDDGKTAFMLACSSGKTDVVKYAVAPANVVVMQTMTH